ncbi:hypothetical protein [Emticicia sp. C21]|uniref:hypothetical protein n=1 Tax=Emticicia sp. C21 TaxID=2302915 RepID=UPI000E345B5A|nr:hypothetical protein [Emticicia sp. C21]RFS17095.1 hypothetical protein D0T08_10500 [Emticicia sp. C21]
MEDKEFFEIYINALEKALNNDEVNYGFSVYAPYDYIDDDALLKRLEKFESDNYNRFSHFFDLIAFYFDAKSHYFDTVGKYSVEEYREKVIKELNTIKEKFLVS